MDYHPGHIAILRYLLHAGEDSAGNICQRTRPYGLNDQATALAQLVDAGDVEAADLFAKYRLTPKAAVQIASGERRPLALMQAAAERLQTEFQMHTDRLQVAGSIRRKRPDGCHDIELVAIAKGPALARALQERALLINKTGPKYTQAIITDQEAGPVLVDLFVTEFPQQWGMLLFIRTGCAQFVERALAHWKSRVSPNGYCHDLTLRTITGQIVPTPEEEDVFSALRCPFVPPERRVEREAPKG